ncbi:MAG: hypothetical protein IJ468_08675 [Lachnospiraceae bacterium]|nr:hypothetical protein [Lachnospiraceae bacterium]
MNEEKNVRRGGGILTISLFAAAMVFFFLMGLLLPLRPAESETEKRKLKEFPTASVESVLNGGYFSELSEWYSDSFPYRDTWMELNDRMKDLYGIRTTQIIQGNAEKDDIPDLPLKTTEDAGEQMEEPSGDVTLEEPGDESGALDETQEPETTQEMTTMEPITAQRLGGVFLSEDTAYGIYYFNQGATETFLTAINRTAKKLEGKADLYCMIVPISASFYLSEETLKSTDGSDEKKALDYYYGSLDSSIKAVEIYDILNEHKNEYIYFRTDHHWTARGAYYAYRKFAEVKGMEPHDLEEYSTISFPGFLGTYYNELKAVQMEGNPDTIEAFYPLTCTTMTFTETSGNQLNWPIVNDVSNYNHGNKYSCFAGSDNPFSVIHNENVTNGEVCLVIKDSYANAMIPFLADHYETLYWIDYRSYNGNIISFVEENGVDDVIYLSGIEPMSSTQPMQRLSGLLP